jgi:NADPH-dependent curcumin reductase CurA
MRRPNRQDQGVPYCRIAGGPDKVRMCREDFRYDSAVDYKADDLEAALDVACPEGVDVYFDNTAGRGFVMLLQPRAELARRAEERRVPVHLAACYDLAAGR